MKNIIGIGILTVLLVASFSCSGCNQPIRNELNYRCDLSGAGVDVNRAFGAKFAAQIAAVAGLRQVNDTPVTGISSADSTYIIELKSNTDEGISVSVLCDRDSKVVAVTIRGNIHAPEAEMIGQKATAVFSEMVPGQMLTPYVARQGLLGP